MATEMTPEQAARYVRERWEDVDVDTNLEDAIVIGDDKFFSTWLAAAEYTRQHEQKIVEKREEIEWVSTRQNQIGDGSIVRRILAVLAEIVLFGFAETAEISYINHVWRKGVRDEDTG